MSYKAVGTFLGRSVADLMTVNLQVVSISQVHATHAVVGGDAVAAMFHRGLASLYQLARDCRSAGQNVTKIDLMHTLGS